MIYFSPFLPPQFEQDVTKQYAPNVWQGPDPWLGIVSKIGVKIGINICAERVQGVEKLNTFV